jgi:putative FmdB family regulatory protein
MPTYEYQCKACGHTLEEFHSITEPPLTRCPKCDTDNLVRVMGTGVGLIFRGTGFYLTDYKKSGGSAPPPGKQGGKSSGETKESKPETAKTGSTPSGGGSGGSGGSSGSSGPGDA